MGSGFHHRLLHSVPTYLMMARCRSDRPSHLPSEGSTFRPILLGIFTCERRRKIILPAFPNTMQLEAWQAALGHALVTATGYTDLLELTWIKKPWVIGVTFDGLALSDDEPGSTRWHALDIRLGGALIAQIRKLGATRQNLIDDMAVKERAAMTTGTVLEGRQMVIMILEHLRTNGNISGT